MKICAIDEVGVSSIAGPVFVCAVVVDSSTPPVPGIADSKKLSKAKRERLFPLIEEAVEDFAYGALGPRQIEKLNIHYAKFIAMRRSIERLLKRGNRIDRTIIDGGFTVPDLPPHINQEAHPKADANFWEVSAASILAKVTRDRLMATLAARDGLDHYDWENNAGYYTPKHRDGIAVHGPTAYHRRTFKYFNYCLFCHEELKRRRAQGETDEQYLAHLASFGMHGHHKAWKRGDLNPWKPVIHGV